MSPFQVALPYGRTTNCNLSFKKRFPFAKTHIIKFDVTIFEAIPDATHSMTLPALVKIFLVNCFCHRFNSELNQFLLLTIKRDCSIIKCY